MGHYVERYWPSDTWYGASGPYRSYVPDELANATLALSPEAADLVAKATAGLTRLDIEANSLTFTEPLARLLMRTEAMASSRIEGLEAPAKRILEAEALDDLGVSHSTSSAEAAVLANITALQSAILAVSKGTQLTLDTLSTINRNLLEGGPLEERGGLLRKEQNWIGGNGYSPVGAAYIPPSPELVPDLMGDLVDFCNDSPLPAVATAAVAHAQFETIHPFVDGNGRTGRALSLLILRREGICTRCVPPISLALASQRKEYLQQLVGFRSDDERGADGTALDVSPFVSFFARAAGASCELAFEFEERVGTIEVSWRERVRPRKNSTADLLLDILPGNPMVTQKSARRLTGRSDEACRLALQMLLQRGVLSQNSRNKKSGIFTADEVLDEFTALERALATPGADTSAASPSVPVPQRKRTKPYGSRPSS